MAPPVPKPKKIKPAFIAFFTSTAFGFSLVPNKMRKKNMINEAKV